MSFKAITGVKSTGFPGFCFPGFSLQSGCGLPDQVEERYGAKPERLLADAGYCNERDLRELEARGIDGYVAAGREGREVQGGNWADRPATGRMAEKLSTPVGQAQYAQRKWLSEAPCGWIKQVLGFRCFSVRGLTKVRGE